MGTRTRTLEDSYTQLIDGPDGGVSAGVIDWLDSNLRTIYCKNAEMKNRRASDLDISESWAEVLMRIYRQNLVTSDWNDLNHLVSWCFWIGYKRLSDFASGRGQSMSYKTGGTKNYVALITDLEQEQFDYAFDIPAPKPDDHRQLGASTGWFQEAYDKLTAKQREAVELTIVESVPFKQVVEYTGQKPGALVRNRQAGMYNIANASPQMDLTGLTMTHPWVRAAIPGMTEFQSQVFECRIVEGLTQRATAECLGRNQAGVGHACQAAVLKLAACRYSYEQVVA